MHREGEQQSGNCPVDAKPAVLSERLSSFCIDALPTISRSANQVSLLIGGRSLPRLELERFPDPSVRAPPIILSPSRYLSPCSSPFTNIDLQ